MRLAQEDILDFSRNPEYRDKTFLDDQWLAAEMPPNDEPSENHLAISTRPQEMQALVADAANGLFGR